MLVNRYGICQGKMREGKYGCVISGKFEQPIHSFCAQTIHTRVVYTRHPRVNSTSYALSLYVSFWFNSGVKYVQSSQNSKEACIISVVLLWGIALSAWVTAQKVVVVVRCDTSWMQKNILFSLFKPTKVGQCSKKNWQLSLIWSLFDVLFEHLRKAQNLETILHFLRNCWIFQNWRYPLKSNNEIVLWCCDEYFFDLLNLSWAFNFYINCIHCIKT